jgi:hypothetical protein
MSFLNKYLSNVQMKLPILLITIIILLSGIVHGANCGAGPDFITLSNGGTFNVSDIYANCSYDVSKNWVNVSCGGMSINYSISSGQSWRFDGCSEGVCATESCVFPRDTLTTSTEITNLYRGKYYINDSDGTDGVLRLGANNHLINGNNAEIIGDSSGFGINLNFKHNVNVYNILLSSFDTLIYSSGSHNLTIQNNIFLNITNVGTRTRATLNAKLINNTYYSNKDDFLYRLHTVDIATNLLIENNTYYGSSIEESAENSAIAIYLSDRGVNTTINNNKFYNGVGAIYTLFNHYFNNTSIKNNYMFNQTNMTIRLFGKDNLILNNELNYIGSYGLYLNSKNTIIQNNIFNNSNKLLNNRGIYILNDDNNISNNSFYNIYDGINLYNGDTHYVYFNYLNTTNKCFIMPSGNYHLIENNTCYAKRNGIEFDFHNSIINNNYIGSYGHAGIDHHLYNSENG